MRGHPPSPSQRASLRSTAMPFLPDKPMHSFPYGRQINQGTHTTAAYYPSNPERARTAAQHPVHWARVMDNAEALANLVAIADIDKATAHQLLEACGGDLEQAVQLHFAQDHHPQQPSASMPAAAHQPHATAAGSARGFASGQFEHEVRAPLPSKVDRLCVDCLTSCHTAMNHAITPSLPSVNSCLGPQMLLQV